MAVIGKEAGKDAATKTDPAVNPAAGMPRGFYLRGWKLIVFRDNPWKSYITAQ